MAFLALQIVKLGTDADGVSRTGRTAADYSFMIGECIIGLALMFLPSVVAKKLTFQIPFSLYVVYVVFLYCAIYLGEVWSFFYKFKYWDVMLHGFSGTALGALGFSIVAFLNKDERVRMKLSPFFVAFFAFCFGLACGALWEICEFSIDGIFGVNMQKFALEDGTKLVGRAALMDTMKDLIVDTCGVLIATVAGYLTIRKDRTQNALNKDEKNK
jgi:uncharacterized membrane protein YjdF